MRILTTITFVIILALGSLFGQTQTPIQNETTAMDPADLQPGIHCAALTVLKGENPQKVKITYVGMDENPLFSNAGLALFDMEDGMPVVAGMSGSPVFCNGKLVGALAYELGNFPLHKALAGVTLIGNMRQQLKTLGRQQLGNTRSVDQLGLRPIEAPMTISNIGSADLVWLNNANQNQNYFFVSGFGGAGSNSAITPFDPSKKPGKLNPGDSVTVFLATGDFWTGGTCTTTEVTEKAFWLCGHPLLEEGSIELPAYRSLVTTTFQSARSSYKIVGKPLEPVGTVSYDGPFGVEVDRQIKPGIMIPVNVQLNINHDRYEYNFDVVRHKFLTSSTTTEGLRSFLDNLWAKDRVGTARLAAKIYLRGRSEPIEIYDADRISMQRAKIGPFEGFSDPWSILGKFQDTLASIQQSEWNLVVDHIQVTLDVWDGNRILMFDSKAVLNDKGQPVEEVHLGDTITVLVGMANEDFSLQLVRKFSFTIPRDLNLVKASNETDTYMPIELVIMSGNNYEELDPNKRPKSKPNSADEFLARMRSSQRNPSEIFAALVLPPEDQKDGEEKKDFP